MNMPPRPHILVVEDDETIRFALRVSLEAEGYAVVTAENGRVALDTLLCGPYCYLVLCDLMMPIMSGEEFLSVLRSHANPYIASRNVILISATLDAEKVSERFSTDLLKKPFDVETILAKI